jgi:hypothetical protein
MLTETTVILWWEDISETSSFPDSAVESRNWSLNTETVPEIDSDLLDLSISKEATNGSCFFTGR